MRRDDASPAQNISTLAGGLVQSNGTRQFALSMADSALSGIDPWSVPKSVE